MGKGKEADGCDQRKGAEPEEPPEEAKRVQGEQRESCRGKRQRRGEGWRREIGGVGERRRQTARDGDSA